MAYSQDEFFKEIDFKSYNQYKLVDTLFVKGSFLVTKRNLPSGFFSFSEFVQIDFGKRKRYFLLNYDAHFINDTSIYAFSPAFKATSVDKGFMQNGIWVYTQILTEKIEGSNDLRRTGKRFAVDSLPINWDYKRLPTKEGIYFYEVNKLVQISSEQSEEAFDSYGKDGFYFIPNTGRLFTKHSIREIK